MNLLSCDDPIRVSTVFTAFARRVKYTEKDGFVSVHRLGISFRRHGVLRSAIFLCGIALALALVPRNQVLHGCCRTVVANAYHATLVLSETALSSLS